jgi:sterol carrier protein 2
MKPRVLVVGVGMTRFTKPGREDAPSYADLAKQAVGRALHDSGLSYAQVQQAVVGYVYGESCSGQRAVYECGMTGIPIYNVNNNCSTGSTALYLAKQLIESGVDCVLALGFDRMSKGSLTSKVKPDDNPLYKFVAAMVEMRELTKAPFAPQLFGNAGLEHMERYGSTREQIAKVAQKNHLHSVNNPYSQFQEPYSLEQILASPLVTPPLTKLQCCPTSDGAAAAIVVSEEFARRNGLLDQAVEIIGMSMKTDFPGTFEGKSCIKVVGSELTEAAAKEAFAQARLHPMDIQVCELHDCFATNEFITYEALGLCEPGKAGEFVDSRQNTYGGRVVINPSGGLISKGHPLGATGLAQCTELCWQLRHMAELRQVHNPRYALQHNLGLGGACVVTIYRKYNSNPGRTRADQTSNPLILERARL